jgi:three-Cys-motif partner protein
MVSSGVRCPTPRVPQWGLCSRSVVRDTVWPLQPHTAAKHRILRCYLDAWFPIMGSWNARILILDGFAGPGIYKGGEEGSPVIALRALMDHGHMPKHLGAGLEVRYHFVEQDGDRVAVLREQIKKFQAKTTLPKGVYVNVAEGEFAPYLDNILTWMEANRRTIAPTFAFIDPFGFAGVPMKLIARLAKNPRCEVLIPFMFDSLNRFAGHQERIDPHLDELYGTTAWRAIAADSKRERRRRGLIDLYRQQLVAAGFPLVTSFEMLDDGNRTEYFLYFGTTNRAGLSAMKQAMWRADPDGGSSFSDHIALNPQLSLVAATAPKQTLRDLLVKQFKGKKASIEMIDDFVLKETIFSEKRHLRRATLAPLERDKKMDVRRPKDKRDIPGQYPPGTSIRFI